jgi:hypothetical protein
MVLTKEILVAKDRNLIKEMFIIILEINFGDSYYKEFYKVEKRNGFTWKGKLD